MERRFLLATGGVVASLILALQGTASAAPTGAQGWPTGCTYQSNYKNGAMAKCDNSNGGHYKAAVDCTRWDNAGVVTMEAPRWRTSGWSQVFCPAQTSFRSAGITTKSS